MHISEADTAAAPHGLHPTLDAITRENVEFLNRIEGLNNEILNRAINVSLSAQNALREAFSNLSSIYEIVATDGLARTDAYAEKVAAGVAQK